MIVLSTAIATEMRVVISPLVAAEIFLKVANSSSSGRGMKYVWTIDRTLSLRLVWPEATASELRMNERERNFILI